MIHTRNGSEVLDALRPVASRGTGVEHWGASYFGPRYSSEGLAPGPQSLMTQMCANETILPHFHGVAQFQIFPAGAGMLARTELRPLMLQYKDHHTGYGPLVAWYIPHRWIDYLMGCGLALAVGLLLFPKSALRRFNAISNDVSQPDRWTELQALLPAASEEARWLGLPTPELPTPQLPGA